jgi:ATP-dependent helicase HrpB
MAELGMHPRLAQQVMRDLAGFWRAGYFEVPGELRGRYPEHVWPEAPLPAAPARQGASRRRSRPPG